jgi:flagellar assembly protein FliH
MSLSDWKAMGKQRRGDFSPWLSGQVKRVFDPLGGAGSAESGDLVKEAERILQEARAQADHIQREAFEKGFSQGEKAGREMAERAMEDTMRALERAVVQWDQILEDGKGAMASEVVRLAFAVARKILQREVGLDQGVVTRVVRAALSRARVREDVVVKVNPLDLETLLEARADLLRELEEVRSLRVESDDSIQRGGALVECSMGELDLRLDRQFREIEQAFERLLQEEKTPNLGSQQLPEAVSV